MFEFAPLVDRVGLHKLVLTAMLGVFSMTGCSPATERSLLHGVRKRRVRAAMPSRPA